MIFFALSIVFSLQYLKYSLASVKLMINLLFVILISIPALI